MNYDVSTKQGMNESVHWTLRHLALIKDGGFWFVPRSASTYKVDHKAKTLTRTGLKSDPSINKVAAAAGWTVIERK